MKIGLVAVGRMKSGPERDLADRYAERFAASGRALGLEGIMLAELPENPARTSSERKQREGEAILAAIPPDSLIICLDERGKSMSSDAFAARIAEWRDAGRKSLHIVIGGADGLDEAVRKKAVLTLSFGQMTIPHQLVRVLALEQLYRAATILAGHPYHRV
jgi:23S rRNA (pseudouridine1915-N3)-methyltransferase